MYRYDTLAMSVATLALRAPGFDALPLVRRMFVSMPLMHAECVTKQREVVRHFEALVAAAEQRSPVNVGFYRFALDYAHRHRDVVERYGRFPHRNELLGRRSTPEEEDYLAEPGAGF